MDIESIMKQAGDMKSKLAKMKETLDEMRVFGDAGAGMVRVTLDGNLKVHSVEISEEALMEGKQVLEELIISAMNDAIIKMEKMKQEKQLEMLGLPAGMNLPF